MLGNNDKYSVALAFSFFVRSEAKKEREEKICINKYPALLFNMHFQSKAHYIMRIHE